MMEFAFSRAAAMICGALILSAVLVPFTGVMDDRESQSYSEHCGSISGMLDAFMSSETDEMVLSMDALLPSAECIISFDGHKVQLTAGDQRYESYMKSKIVADGGYGSTDIVRFQKKDGVIIASREYVKDSDPLPGFRCAFRKRMFAERMCDSFVFRSK